MVTDRVSILAIIDDFNFFVVCVILVEVIRHLVQSFLFDIYMYIHVYVVKVFDSINIVNLIVASTSLSPWGTLGSLVLLVQVCSGTVLLPFRFHFLVIRSLFLLLLLGSMAHALNYMAFLRNRDLLLLKEKLVGTDLFVTRSTKLIEVHFALLVELMVHGLAKKVN